jgi:hypothetical protein
VTVRLGEGVKVGGSGLGVGEDERVKVGEGGTRVDDGGGEDGVEVMGGCATGTDITLQETNSRRKNIIGK